MKFDPLFESEAGYIEDNFIVHHKSRIPSNQLVLLLHGFPGWINKNYDVAELLCGFGYDALIIHYKGLGHSRGKFNLVSSVSEPGNILDKYISQFNYQTISCIGHSWGGMVSSSILNRINGWILWMAPLITLPDDNALKGIISGLFRDAPGDCDAYTPESMFKELREIGKSVDQNILTSLGSKIKTVLIHGTKDTVLPISLSATLANSVKGLDFIKIDDDHGFSLNRRHFLEIVRSKFPYA